MHEYIPVLNSSSSSKLLVSMVFPDYEMWKLAIKRSSFCLPRQQNAQPKLKVVQHTNYDN